jgi:GDPmannose 4,6-dehydratase
MKKRALITGISGQTGSYLAELLLEKGYEVHGMIRRSSLIKTDRIDHIFDRINLHYGDLTDGMNLMTLVKKIQPDEIYNMAAQSHVAVSFETPEYTANADALGTLRFLEIINNVNPKIKFYQASTSELYGSTVPPQNEQSYFAPQSPYAAAKLYAYWLTRNYREGYGLFAINGILFNHEGPRRGETFVTRKITRHVAQYKLGINQGPLQIGNVHAVRDWSDARDMVRGIYLMMQQSTPDDYVLGSGQGRTVLDLLITAFATIDIVLEWDDDLEQGKDANTGELLVTINPRYKRPLEVNALVADTSKANKELGWMPEITFKQMIEEMVANDILSFSK